MRFTETMRTVGVVVAWSISMWPSGGAAQTPDHYRIDASGGESPVQYRVTSRLHPTEARLQMSGYGAWGEPNGWATFVSNLSVSDCAGTSLAVEKVDRLEWSLPGWQAGEICVTYDLDFTGAVSEPWPDGPRTTGIYSDGRALFTNSGALFVFSDSTRSGEVEFGLPPAQEVTTAWKATGTRSYAAPMSALLRNTVVIGDHDRSVQSLGPLRVQTVMLGAMRPAVDLVNQAVTAIGGEYLSTYPQPQEGSLLFVWFPDGGWETGEAYQSSFAIVSATIPGVENRMIWANSIGHELHHYWLGHLARAADWEAGNWFVEGLSEYKANVSLVRSGLVTEAQFLDLVRKHLTLFHNFQFHWGTPYQRISLVKAGSEKSTTNVAVYDGGWFAGLMFEVLMRQASEGTVGVDELLAALVRRYGGTEFTNDDAVQVAEELSGADIRPSYDDYVAGTRRMPLVQYLQQAGFEATVTPYAIELALDPRPDDAALRVRRAILRGVH